MVGDDSDRVVCWNTPRATRIVRAMSPTDGDHIPSRRRGEYRSTGMIMVALGAEGVNRRVNRERHAMRRETNDSPRMPMPPRARPVKR